MSQTRLFFAVALVALVAVYAAYTSPGSMLGTDASAAGSWMRSCARSAELTANVFAARQGARRSLARKTT